MQSLRDFYWLARPYWGDRRNWKSWVFLIAIIAMGLILVRMNLWFSFWNKDFYDALAVVNTAKIYPLLRQYCLLIAGAVLIAVYLDWLRKLLILRWREALTADLLGLWLDKHAFYRLTLRSELDNPDQRIAEDINLLVSDSIDLLRSFISAIARIVSFAGLLWALSSQLILPLGDTSVRIPGYLVWFSIAYAVFGAAVTQWIGQQLFGLNYEQQRREADFRAALVRKRDHAEEIALLGGEAREKQQLLHHFAGIAGNWVALMNRERMLAFFTVSYNRIDSMVPLFAALPAFLHKSITLGDLMQISTAFVQVSMAMSWFVQAYDNIAKWSATVARLRQFRTAIEHEHTQWQQLPDGACLEARGLTLHKPDGEVLLHDIELKLYAGQWLHLDGASGIGKSTLLRTLSGIWPYYRGECQRHAGRTLLLPQTPYLPADTLAALLSYPERQQAESERLAQALNDVGLGRLVDQLEVHQEWGRILSGGEQQRLSIARALVYRPDCLLLDEATSQLDEVAAPAMLQLLKARLSHCAVLGISHQSMLHACFDSKLSLSAHSVPAPTKTESYIFTPSASPAGIATM